MTKRPRSHETSDLAVDERDAATVGEQDAPVKLFHPDDAHAAVDDVVKRVYLLHGCPRMVGVTVFKFHTTYPPHVGLFRRLPASLLSHPPRPRHRPGWHAGRIMRSSPWRVALGKTVRTERVRRGWSLRRAEGESGVSDSTWQRIESGREVHDQSLRDIEDALEWSPGRCFEIMARAAR